MIILNAMIAGAIAMASLVISLFFLHYWKSTRDTFFLYFTISFLLEAINRIGLGLLTFQNEQVPIYYMIRVIAYLLILFAIFDKNRKKINGNGVNH